MAHRTLAEGMQAALGSANAVDEVWCKLYDLIQADHSSAARRILYHDEIENAKAQGQTRVVLSGAVGRPQDPIDFEGDLRRCSHSRLVVVADTGYTGRQPAVPQLGYTPCCAECWEEVKNYYIDLHMDAAAEEERRAFLEAWHGLPRAEWAVVHGHCLHYGLRVHQFVARPILERVYCDDGTIITIEGSEFVLE